MSFGITDQQREDLEKEEYIHNHPTYRKVTDGIKHKPKAELTRAEPNSSSYVFTELKYPDALNGYTRNGSKLIDVPELYLSSEDYDRIYKNVVGDILEAANQKKISKCDTCVFRQNCLIKDSNISNDCDAYAEKDSEEMKTDCRTCVYGAECFERELIGENDNCETYKPQPTMNVMAMPNTRAYVMRSPNRDKAIKLEAYKEFAAALKAIKFRVDICDDEYNVVDVDDFDDILRELEKKLNEKI